MFLPSRNGLNTPSLAISASPGGSTATGISSTYLTAEVATSGQFQITGYAYLVTDSPTDAYVNMSVRLNEAQYKAPVNTI